MKRVLLPEKARAVLIGTTVAGVVGAIIYFALIDSQPGHPVKPSADGNRVVDKTNSSDPQIQSNPDLSIEGSEGKRQIALKEFAEKLARRHELGRFLVSEQRRISSENPLIQTASDYGVRHAGAAAKARPEMVAELIEFERANKRLSDEIHEAQRRLYSLSAIAEGMDSMDKVDGTTFGAIASTVVSNEDYLNSVCAKIRETETTYFATDASAIPNQKGILNYLLARAPTYLQRYDEFLEANVRSDALRAFIRDVHAGAATWQITQDYKEQHMSHLSAVEREIDRLGGEMARLKDSVPLDSPENSKMAQLMIDASAEE